MYKLWKVRLLPVCSDSTCLTFHLDKIGRAKPNLNVLKEYKERETEFLRRHDDLEKVIAERDAQKKTYEDLRKQRLEEFMAGFSTISLKLKEMYQVKSVELLWNEGT